MAQVAMAVTSSPVTTARTITGIRVHVCPSVIFFSPNLVLDVARIHLSD